MTQTPDLLAGLEEEAAPVNPGTMDLLSQIAEDDGKAWMPWNDEAQPKGIQGRVTAISTVGSDYGDKEDVPLVIFTDPEGTVWSIRGYGTVLLGQLKANLAGGMKVGDHFAARYLGEQQGKQKFPYHNVKTAFAPVG